MRFSTLFLLPVLFYVCSCGQEEPSSKVDTFALPDSVPTKVPPTNGMTFHAGMQVDCKTFEITDSINSASHGWGYDLYVGNKKIIHQAIMPAVGGICAFMTEADAMKMGSLAAYRFGSTGNFPTIVLNDYDSLDIQMPSALKKQVDSMIKAQKKNTNAK